MLHLAALLSVITDICPVRGSTIKDNQPHFEKFHRDQKHHHSVKEFIVAEYPQNNHSASIILGRAVHHGHGTTSDASHHKDGIITLKIGNRKINVTHAKLENLTVHHLEELEKLEKKVERLHKHFSNYTKLKVKAELVEKFKKEHAHHEKHKGRGIMPMGRGIGKLTLSRDGAPVQGAVPMMGRGIHMRMSGRSAASADDDGKEGDDQSQGGAAGDGGTDTGVGSGFDDANVKGVEEEKVFKQYPKREWGDECTPNFQGGDDECSLYTNTTYPGNNAKLLDCDHRDRLCLCAEDVTGKRAEYSKEREVCLIPKYYPCKNTTDCAPLLVCERATKRDYVIDPGIRPGHPFVCRLKVNLTNEATPWSPSFRISLINLTIVSVILFFCTVIMSA